MADLRAWWGRNRSGERILLVAAGAEEAAKLVGLRSGDLPFKFDVRAGLLPLNVFRSGVYRNFGGVWVRDEPAKPPPDPEDP